MDIECALRDQLGAIKLLQTENGLWRTILNDEESYEEVSASCGIAAAMVVNKNPIHTKYIQKAIKGILANISEDGRVLNVSGGTAVMNDRDGYKNISKDWTQGWGQGLALAFLTAVINDK
jgi:unsaturated rhamnogalacturonyl hydrolase